MRRVDQNRVYIFINYKQRFSSQKYHLYTVRVWFWPTLEMDLYYDDQSIIRKIKVGLAGLKMKGFATKTT